MLRPKSFKPGSILHCRFFELLAVFAIVISSFAFVSLVTESSDADDFSYEYDSVSKVLTIRSQKCSFDDIKALPFVQEITGVKFTAEDPVITVVRDMAMSLDSGSRIEIFAVLHEPGDSASKSIVYLDMDGNEIEDEEEIVGTFVKIKRTKDEVTFKQFSKNDVLIGDGLVYEKSDSIISIMCITGYSITGNMSDFTHGSPNWGNFDVLNAGIGVNSIGAYAFQRSVVKEVYAPISCTVIGDHAFASSHVDTVELSRVKQIGSHAFDGCMLLSAVYCKSLEEIGEGAFKGCYSLETIDLPASLKLIDGPIFEDCVHLKAINVAKGNENYSSIDGVLFQNRLFQNSGTVLVRFPQAHGSEYTIPYGVTTLDSQSFQGCNNMKYLGFPESINNIAADFMDGVKFYSSSYATDPIDCNSYSTELPGAIFESIDGINMYKRGALPKVVTFDATPGICPISSMTTNQGNMLDSYPTAYYDGYKFEGWYLDKESGERILVNHKYYKDTTIYAHYSPIKLSHHVIYDIDGGSGEAPTQADVAEGDSFVVQLYTGIKSGFEFSGWQYADKIYHAGDVITMGASNITLTAKWSPLVYHHVIYDIDGGSGEAPESIMVLEGDSFIADQYAGTKTGHVFTYWFCSGSYYCPGDEVLMGDEDMVLTAVWNPKPFHHVIYDTRGGSGFTPIQEDVRGDAVFKVKTYDGVKEGYHFIGWIYSDHVYLPGDDAVMGDTDMTFLAFWASGEVHHVTYDVDGGDAPAPIQDDVIEGYTFSLSSYSGTKKGYIFKGWAYGDAIYRPGDLVVMIDKDMVFTAIWDAVSLHHVVYDTRGGSKSAPVQSDVPIGASFTVQGYDGIKEHYTFNGWMFKTVLYHPGDVFTMNEEDVIFRADWKSTESPSGGWQNPMLIFLCTTIVICVILEIFAHMLFKRW